VGVLVAHHGGMADPLLAALRAHVPHDAEEAGDLARTIAMAEAEADPWSRAIPLHVTASALVLDPATGRVVLRWHAKQERWLQVGGHGDPGERDPWIVALREAQEETGLTDLAPVNPELATPGLQVRRPGVASSGDERLFQVTVVSVSPAKGEPPHEHADLRYLLRTERPDDLPTEREGVALRWFTLAEGLEVADDGLARLLRRVPGVR
jgi:8-oxo-dGTP pyrophosphatase MutT (NUDIX family)